MKSEMERPHAKRTGAAGARPTPERRRGRYISIRIKMIAISLLLLIVVIGLFGVINSIRTKRIIDESSKRQAAAVTRSLRQAGAAKLQLLAGTAQIGLVQGDYSTLQIIVRDIKKQDELVTEAAVMESSGRLLAHSDPKKVATRAKGALKDLLSVRKRTIRSGVVVGGQRSIIFASPVRYKDLRTWIVVMAYSLQPLEAELAKAETRRRREVTASFQDTLAIGLLAVALGLLLTILQSLRISRPIQALARKADQIAGGDLTAHVDVGTNDEIGLLGDRFNYMTERVRALLQEVQDKAAVEREVEVATALQSTLIPEASKVEVAGLALAGFFRPAARCGGDWWSYYELADDQMLLLIGDVTGHGLPSAMITAVVKGAANNMISVTRGRIELNELLRELHVAVLQTARGRYAMTCFASIYNPKDRTLLYSNAGHTFPYLYQSEDHSQWLAVRGSLLGDEECCAYETCEVKLNPEDLLVWYTDGVVEGEGSGGEPFGHKRLSSSIHSHGHLPVDRARDQIISDMYQHYGDIPQADDITLVVGKVD